MLIYQSMMHGVVGAFALGVLFASPWIAATAWLWRREADDDGTVIPSLGQTALRRLGL